MAQVLQKVCCICGKDVAQQKRTKDSEGNYYCGDCYSAEHQGIAKANAGTVAAPASSHPNEMVQRSIPNQGLIRKARWFAVVAAIALCTIAVDAIIFNSEIGGRSANVVIPVIASFGLSFFVLTFIALWLARNWRKVVKKREQPLFGRFTYPLIIAARVFVVLLILLGIMSMFLDRSDKGSSSSSSVDSGDSELPAIHINDRHGEVKFSDWEVKGYDLVGTLVANGPWKIDTITYTTRRNGVVKQRGDVSVPGDYFSKAEKVEATISCWEETKGLDVTIEVGY
jgi:hypothetical protein